MPSKCRQKRILIIRANHFIEFLEKQIVEKHCFFQEPEEF